MPLIVLEGLDGAGKSTQVKLLNEYFINQGKSTFLLHFPRLQNPYFGELISSFLRGEFGDIHQVHPRLVALLYAGDRWDASQQLSSYLSQQYVVILDRYVYSNIAYQCAKLTNEYEKEELRNWILQFEFEYFKIPKPDINIFLDMPITFVEKKLKEHRQGDDRAYLKGKEDIHEKNISFQEKVRNEYLYLCTHYDLLYLNCAHNEAIESAEHIFKRIINLIEANLNSNKL
ncbi:MAG: dTMP kinase [Bacteroidales bacterium]|nr:dTMP kinase [Bacteroidales bacterium]